MLNLITRCHLSDTVRSCATIASAFFIATFLIHDTANAQAVNQYSPQVVAVPNTNSSGRIANATVGNQVPKQMYWVPGSWRWDEKWNAMYWVDGSWRAIENNVIEPPKPQAKIAPSDLLSNQSNNTQNQKEVVADAKWRHELEVWRAENAKRNAKEAAFRERKQEIDKFRSKQAAHQQEQQLKTNIQQKQTDLNRAQFALEQARLEKRRSNDIQNLSLGQRQQAGMAQQQRNEVNFARQLRQQTQQLSDQQRRSAFQQIERRRNFQEFSRAKQQREKIEAQAGKNK